MAKKKRIITAKVDEELYDEFSEMAKSNGKKKKKQAKDVINVYVRGHFIGRVRGERSIDVDFDENDTVDITLKIPKAVVEIATGNANYAKKNTKAKTSVQDRFKDYIIDAEIGHRYRILKCGKKRE